MTLLTQKSYWRLHALASDIVKSNRWLSIHMRREYLFFLSSLHQFINNQEKFPYAADIY